MTNDELLPTLIGIAGKTALQHLSVIPALTAAFQSIYANIQRFLLENNY